MSTVHKQMDFIPGVSPNTQFDVAGYDCTEFSRLHCVQVLYNAYYHLSGDSLANLFPIPINAGIRTYRTYSTGTFPNYDDVYFRGGDFYEFPTYNIQNIIAWLPSAPVVVRIKDFLSIDSKANIWEEGDPIINWAAEGGSTSETNFHDVLVVDYGNYGAQNDSTYFTIMNSLYSSGPGYFKIYADNNWIFPKGERATCGFIRIHNSITTSPNGFGGDTNLNYDLAPRIFPQFIPAGNKYTTTNMIGYGVNLDDKDPPLQYGHANPEGIYLFGDIVVPYSYTFNVWNGSPIHVSTEVKGSNLGGYPSKNEIIVKGGTLNLQTGTKVSSLSESPSAGDWGQISITTDSLSHAGALTVGDSVSISDAMIGLNIGVGGSQITFPTWSSTTSRKCTISNCHDWGMLVSSNPSGIQNIEFSGNGTSDSHGSLCVMSGSSAPIIDHVTIGSTVYGAYATNLSNMNLRYSKFDSSIQRHMVFLYSPSTSLSMENGNNNFLYTGDGTYHAIWNPSTFSLNVTNNYWNGVTNQNWLFENPAYITGSGTTYNNSSAGAYKTISPIVQNNPILEAEQLEKNGEYNAARDVYRQVLSSNSNPHEKSFAVKALIRASEIDSTLSDMSACDSVISDQLSSATDWYKALLDYLKCDMTVKRARRGPVR